MIGWNSTPILQLWQTLRGVDDRMEVWLSLLLELRLA